MSGGTRYVHIPILFYSTFFLYSYSLIPGKMMTAGYPRFFACDFAPWTVMFKGHWSNDLSVKHPVQFFWCYFQNDDSHVHTSCII